MDIFGLEFVFSFFPMLRITYLSTMLLKQHSCIDVVLGAALAFALDAAASSLERSGEMRRIPQRL